MNSRLFREEALARRGRPEPLDGLLRVTAPHMWVALAGLAILLIAAVIWAFLGRVDETIDADCAVVLPGDRYAVLSEATGTIEEALVDVGDVVRAGQPLARIRTPSLGRELDNTAAGQVMSSWIAGEIAAHRLIPGRAVEIGSQIALVRAGGATPMEAVAFVPQEAARRIRAGQLATVMRVATSDQALSAVVSDISSRPAAADGWLADLGFSPPPRSQLVRLSLVDQPAVRPADGEGCRLRIVVRTHAPIGLLGYGTVAERAIG